MADDDEFDDDAEYEPRRSKISWKGLLKGLAIMVIIIAALYMLNQGWGNGALMTGGIMLMCIGTTLMNLRMPKRKKIKTVYSIYKCSVAACGVKELHEFKEGDYVFKTIGPCFKCSGSLYIDQIFAVQSLPEKSARMARPEGGPSVLPGDD
ncbi:MAG: hypothetical protein JW839_14220 [Candidatus Lokiarchaeota archaeon]|nr:hypothetical protein [Candidatus Lokiarchaeota archaeon]